jgi:transposase
MVADIQAIRGLAARGWSERQIARELHIARKTVHKYGEAAEVVPRYRQGEPRRRPVVSQVAPLIDRWLAADEQAPRKQRHTAHRIWERLTQEYGYRVAESTVRRYVRQAQAKAPAAFMPLTFEYGYAQADWGEAVVVIAGVRQQGIYFAIRLYASEDRFVQIFPTHQQEAMFEGHVRAFAHFGGAPHSILYDNDRVLVAKVGPGRVREEQPGFAALRAHYGFAADFCPPGVRGAHEKGSIENTIGWIRRNFLVPVPEAASWDALNAQLAQRCLAQREQHHSRTREPITALVAREQAHLLRLPAVAFPCCVVRLVQVNRYAMVTYDRCRYSVPTPLVGRTLTLKAYVDRIVVVDGERVVADHRRSYSRGEEVLQVAHYLDLLRQRPSTVAHARVFRALPAPYEVLRQWCLRQDPPATREFVAVLELWREFAGPVVTAALEQALAAGVYQAAAVRQLCVRAHPADAAPPPLPAVPATAGSRTAGTTLATPDLAQFDRLLVHGAGVA